MQALTGSIGDCVRKLLHERLALQVELGLQVLRSKLASKVSLHFLPYFLMRKTLSKQVC
jgi:hypothetical protein